MKYALQLLIGLAVLTIGARAANIAIENPIQLSILKTYHWACLCNRYVSEIQRVGVFSMKREDLTPETIAIMDQSLKVQAQYEGLGKQFTQRVKSANQDCAGLASDYEALFKTMTQIALPVEKIIFQSTGKTIHFEMDRQMCVFFIKETGEISSARLSQIKEPHQPIYLLNEAALLLIETTAEEIFHLTQNTPPSQPNRDSIEDTDFAKGWAMLSDEEKANTVDLCQSTIRRANHLKRTAVLAVALGAYFGLENKIQNDPQISRSRALAYMTASCLAVTFSVNAVLNYLMPSTNATCAEIAALNRRAHGTL